jgi:hypothetical protein
MRYQSVIHIVSIRKYIPIAVMYKQGTDRTLLRPIKVTAAHSSCTYMCLTEC